MVRTLHSVVCKLIDTEARYSIPIIGFCSSKSSDKSENIVKFKKPASKRHIILCQMSVAIVLTKSSKSHKFNEI